jgi:hypothetical protein
MEKTTENTEISRDQLVSRGEINKSNTTKLALLSNTTRFVAVEIKTPKIIQKTTETPKMVQKEPETSDHTHEASKTAQDLEESNAPLAGNPPKDPYRTPRANIHKWHERLAYLSRTQLKRLHSAKLIHILRQPGEQGACDICSQSKAIKKPSHDLIPETKRPFERFHFDLLDGKQSLPFSEGRYKYILIVTNDYSQYK